MADDFAVSDNVQCFKHGGQCFLQKAYSVQTDLHYIVSFICYMTIVESDYFLST